MGAMMDEKKQEQKLKPKKGFSKGLVSLLGQTDFGTKKGGKKAEKLLVK